MPSVAVDSSVLYALFDESDGWQVSALNFLASNRDELVTNMVVMTEVLYLLQWSGSKQREFLGFAASSLVFDGETPSDLARIAEIMKKYDDLPASFADAALLAMCERTGVDRIATFDSDFDIYRMMNGKALTNVMSQC